MNRIDDPKARENIEEWLQGPFRQEVLDLIEKSPKEAIDAFYKKLEFGTAGIRGIVGLGTNRINSFTIQSAAQALANYLLESGVKTPSVVIGYDNRTDSRAFAEDAARVFAGNGIKAYLIKELRPTPYLSFALRHKHCDAGCMITASHNPKEYNGFKVYWNDGGQVLPPHDIGVIQAFNKICGPGDIKMGTQFEEIEVDEAYIDAITSLQLQPEIDHEMGDRLRIVYTSLHGTGITLLPQLFKRWGFLDLYLVEEQCIPDGNFSTVKFPNPEEREALKLGIERLAEVDGDILLATDPDADRVGVVVKHDGGYHILNGNQIAALLAEHVFSQISGPGYASIKSIVTTELFRKIADKHNIACFDILPGFKYVAEKIREWESEGNYRFTLAAEESFGYLYGTKSRDKDALIASLLIAECALNAKLQGKTLIDVLQGLYQKHGFFLEKQHTIAFKETKEGKEAMKQAMERILKAPPEVLHGKRATKIANLREGIEGLPKTDMVILYYDGGQTLMIRPSGTEPKIKVYLMLERKPGNLENLEKEAEEIFGELAQFLENYH